jgi:gluconokinase
MGIYNSLEEATREIDVPGMYKPDKRNHELYMGLFRIFERLSSKLADDFEEIANWQSQ